MFTKDDGLGALATAIQQLVVHYRDGSEMTSALAELVLGGEIEGGDLSVPSLSVAVEKVIDDFQKAQPQELQSRFKKADFLVP